MRYWFEKYSDDRHRRGNWQPYVYRSSTNIATEFVGNLRGKLVMVFDGKKHPLLDPEVGLHPFQKYEEHGDPDMGLATCGKYADSSDTKAVIDQSLQAAERHFNHGPLHLHFVYYQQTMNIPRQMTGSGSIEAATHAPGTGAHANLPDFLAKLLALADEHNVGVDRFANVISHDFVDENTCKQIISLNDTYRTAARSGAAARSGDSYHSSRGKRGAGRW
jgi:hypothetical protein